MKIILNPQCKLFWTPSKKSPKAVVATLGKERQVFSCLSFEDVYDIKVIAEGNSEINNNSRVANWLIQNGFAFKSEASFIPHNFKKWSRQISYYTNYTSFQNALELQEKLFTLRFLIVGIGGIGCNMILQLQSLGVKHFILVDDDTIELSNLNRQILFNKSDIGKAKVVVAAKKMKRKDPTAEIQIIQKNALDNNLQKILPNKFDYAIISADTPSILIRKIFSKFLYKRKIPYAFLSYYGTMASIGPVVFDTTGGCGCCILNLIDFSNELEEIKGKNICNIAPSSYSTNSFITSFYTNELVKHLCGIDQSNGNWIFNLLTNEIKFKKFKRYENCSVCGKNTI